MLRRLLKPLWILAALVFLFEAWLWERLAPIVAWIVDRLALPRLKARLHAFVDRLPPLAVLPIFLLPAALLFPIKLAGLWMLAQGSWIGAMAVLGLAKVVSMGVTAFIFDLTRPKLLQLGWFRWIYAHVLTLLAWAHAHVDPLKARLRAWARATLGPIARRITAWVRVLRSRHGGRFLRRMLRLRRRVQGT